MTRTERLAPWIAGAIHVLITWWVWGATLDPVPVVHDEAAYVLQAQLIAHGQLAGPAPPLPEFFEQFHVLVTPVLAPKYPLGQGLVLAPGVLLGLPAVIPLLLAWLSGALVYVLARRHGGTAAAIFATTAWTMAPMVVRFSPSYISQPTTEALWLLGFWVLDRWWRAPSRRDLLLLAVITGFGVIVRPLTMLAFAMPVGLGVVYRLWQVRDAWLDLPLAVGAGLLPLVLLVAQNQVATGHWDTMPYGVYTRAYMPYDRYGFGLDSTAGTRALPPDQALFRRTHMPQHATHLVSRLPAIVLERVALIGDEMRPSSTIFCLILAAIGALAAWPVLLLPIAALVALFILHLPFVHTTTWVAYYLEGTPVVAWALASGLRAVIARLASAASIRDDRRLVVTERSLVGASVLWAASGAHILPTWHDIKRDVRSEQVAVREAERKLPTPAIVFVRYMPRHAPDISLIVNAPDAESAPLWTAYDRGEDNQRLMRVAPERQAFLFDEATLTFTALPPAR